MRIGTKILKPITFAVWAVVICLLVATTIAERIYGTEQIQRAVYGSWWFVGLWIGAVLLSLLYLFSKKIYKRFSVLSIHLAFVVILVGALITFFTAECGTIHLRAGEAATPYYHGDEDVVSKLPVAVELKKFEVIYYEGTSSPADYSAEITLYDTKGELLTEGTVSMNRILSCKGWRLYQSGYDEDEEGCTLMVSHDPWGILITYTGYLLLLLSILLFSFTRIRAAKHSRRGVIAFIAVICLFFTVSCASPDLTEEAPKVLPRDVAAEFGDLYVLYQGRICPLQTLAKDFTVKLYGKSHYKQYTPEQVFTGWMFFYSDWKKEPMIKIKSGTARKILGIQGGYAALTDFRNRHNEYKLDSCIHEMMRNDNAGESKSIIAADEKFNLIATFYSGKLMKIYPYRLPDDSLRIEWYSQGGRLPAGIEDEDWFFIKKSWDYIFELVINKEYEQLSATLAKVRQYQQTRAGGLLPSESKFEAEKFYNRYAKVKLLMFLSLFSGLLLFVPLCFSQTGQRNNRERAVEMISQAIPIALFVALTLLLGLRWYIGGHIPLSNGPETMQFMAWCSLFMSFLFYKRYKLILPSGLIICALTLAVSVMGEANPPITSLIPVLSSPLLSLHVATVMIAYSLFAFMMLNGMAASLFYFFRKDRISTIANMYAVSRLLLYAALFFLTIGIFLGAIWANLSWGRYWGWDPKEVWALITLLIYASALHAESLPAFRRPMFFHLFAIVAFLSVLITYFGVNYFLGGMHSYAG